MGETQEKDKKEAKEPRGLFKSLKMHARGIAASAFVAAISAAGIAEEAVPAFTKETTTQIVTTTITKTYTTTTPIIVPATDKQVLDYVSNQFFSGLQPVAGLIGNVLGSHQVVPETLDQARNIANSTINSATAACAKNAAGCSPSLGAWYNYLGYLHQQMGVQNGTATIKLTNSTVNVFNQVAQVQNSGAQDLLLIAIGAAAVGCLILGLKIRQAKRDSEKEDTFLETKRD